jgi:hypothetical protein
MGRGRSLSSVVPEGEVTGKSGKANGLPFFYPKEKPLELLFFRRLFSRLDAIGQSDPKGVPVAFFQRAMARLYKVLDHEGEEFEVKTYDLDGNGFVDWPEFCKCWRKSKIKVKLSSLERIHVMLDSVGCSGSVLAKILSNFIMFVIFVSSMSFMLSTLLVCRNAPENDPDGVPQQHEAFLHLEFACVMVFSVEYMLRLLTARATRLELLDQDQLLDTLVNDQPLQWLSPAQRTWRFVSDPSNVIDILAILPWYLEKMMSVSANLTFLRMVRLVRVLRVLRINSIQDAVDTLGKTLVMSSASLYVLCFYIVLGVIISSSLIYFTECGTWTPNVDGEYADEIHGVYIRKTWDDQPDRSPFTSIPKAIWFVIVTVTTVGYGDINLITNTGRLVGTLTIVAGAVAFAMPMGVISSNFARVWEDKEKTREETKEFLLKEAHTVSTELVMGNRVAELVLKIYDDQGVGNPPVVLGQAVIPMNLLEARFTPEKPAGTTLTLSLNPPDRPMMLNGMAPESDEIVEYDNKAYGNVKISLLWVPDNAAISDNAKQDLLKRKQVLTGTRSSMGNMWDTPEVPPLVGELTVGILSASGLQKHEKEMEGESDPFARVLLYTQRHLTADWETQVKENDNNPQWDEYRTFSLDWRDSKSNRDQYHQASRQIQKNTSSRSLGSESSTDLRKDADLAFNAFGEKLVGNLEKEVDFWKEKYQALYNEAAGSEKLQANLKSDFQSLYQETLQDSLGDTCLTNDTDAGETALSEIAV